MSAPPRDALLDALDRVREVRGTLALFDAVSNEDASALRQALAAHPRHPLRSRLEDWLRSHGVEPIVEADPVGALARHGIDDLDAYVDSRDAREGALRRAVDDANAARDLAVRSANAYALVAALLALLALSGWYWALEGFSRDSAIVPATPTGTAAAASDAR